MKILTQAPLLFFAFGIIAGCQKPTASQSLSRDEIQGTYCREFSTSTVPEVHCLVPYSALIANARDYDGMMVYTYAYLQLSQHGVYGLSAERTLRSQPDFASCIGLDPIDVRLPEEGMSVYSVAIAGRFEFFDKGHCLGILRKPIVDAMQLEVVARDYESLGLDAGIIYQ